MESRPENSQESARSKDEKAPDEGRSEGRPSGAPSDPPAPKRPGRARQEAWGKERSSDSRERILRGDSTSDRIGSPSDVERDSAGSRDGSGQKIWMSMRSEARLEFIDVEDEEGGEGGRKEGGEEARGFVGFHFPEGEPIPSEATVGLRLLTLGELGKAFSQEWMQGLLFSDNPSLPFGLVQFKVRFVLWLVWSRFLMHL